MALWLVTLTSRHGTSCALIKHPEPPEWALVEASMVAQFDHEPDREDEWRGIAAVRPAPDFRLRTTP